MASVSSAFQGVVSADAASYFLNAIPEALRNNILNEADLSQGLPGESFVGTQSSDYVVLGLGDRLSQGVSGVDGFDIVETGAAIKLDGTGFRGAILTGDKNIGATGSDYGDALVGNSGNNILKGGLGDDVISGRDGDDRLEGGGGNDTLFGDGGNDILDGGAGNDLLRGGEGNDLILGGDGADSLFGDAGNDTLFGDAGDDFLSGMTGDDVLFGGAGSDTLFGGDGHDTFMITPETSDDVDVISDFNPDDDIIDLSLSGATNFGQISATDDGQGNTIIKLPDQTQFKLIGFTSDQIDEKFFSFI